MKKNIVFMFNIKMNNSKLEGDRWLENRSDTYKYSVKSWQKWCDANNADLFVIDERLLPNQEMSMSVPEYYILEYVESKRIAYNHVMYMYADTKGNPD